ncbi:uncharacterized protein M421DRAFT_237804 [Didymella exigua CBS 183.55]|uniref:Uncharacterized protein n=1 Tax=Didymella exigua CBS 183.55 TaxID=1150837 RepID=A0A6A5RDV4_9PLEO|nr:uncharacterized protein M421DRAFT_237804 [Didymella exigua CBS 183.55]KAF1925500.1 hypothetical protein M421DRAFT_237804 [Didymella exigua CBS 183.55]
MFHVRLLTRSLHTPPIDPRETFVLPLVFTYRPSWIHVMLPVRSSQQIQSPYQRIVFLVQCLRSEISHTNQPHVGRQSQLLSSKCFFRLTAYSRPDKYQPAAKPRRVLDLQQFRIVHSFSYLFLCWLGVWPNQQEKALHARSAAKATKIRDHRSECTAS